MQIKSNSAIVLIASYATSTWATAHSDAEVHTHAQNYGDWLLAMLSGENLLTALLVGGSLVLVGVAHGWLQQRRQRDKQERSDDTR